MIPLENCERIILGDCNEVLKSNKAMNDSDFKKQRKCFKTSSIINGGDLIKTGTNNTLFISCTDESIYKIVV